jgi:hypothetical protein
MEKFGELLGWVTGVCFAAAVLTYLVKRINKRWILALPKESAARQAYQTGMKLVVKNHRWFGIAAAAAAAAHLLVQILWNEPSVTGLTAAGLLAATAVLGMIMLRGRRGKLLNLHRIVAAAAVAVVIVHVIAKG